MKSLQIKALILSLLLLLSACEFSKGERVGTVVKLSMKGYIFKTCEGELSTLARGAQSTMMVNSFLFSVEDVVLCDRINQAMKDGHKVSLSYEEQYFVWPWEADTTYIISGISILDKGTSDGNEGNEQSVS